MTIYRHNYPTGVWIASLVVGLLILGLTACDSGSHDSGSHNTDLSDPGLHDKGEPASAQKTASFLQVLPIDPYVDVDSPIDLTAYLVSADGKAIDVSNESSWAIGDSQVLTSTGDFSGSRHYRATQTGKVTVKVSYNQFSGSSLVTVRKLGLQGRGALSISKQNPRYFSDKKGNLVYLAGAHTWNNFQNSGPAFPPEKFDYLKYVDFLQKHKLNFFRLWTWEQAHWAPWTDKPYWFDTSIYERTGPGKAEDGGDKFDLHKFNAQYFSRLRDRVLTAGEHGIYVSIMLFDGWSIETKGDNKGNPWKGHPYNSHNNINGINGDLNHNGQGEEIHTLANGDIVRLQEEYVKKVVDTVNDMDNVLFEISNESHNQSTSWQYHMINYLKDYEKTMPKQHPVGMTVQWPEGSNNAIFDSPADWVSPNPKIIEPYYKVLYRKIIAKFGKSMKTESYKTAPPVARGDKVVVLDTDHLWGIGGDRQWVWRSFLRGYNLLLMDPYDGQAKALGGFDSKIASDTKWEMIRNNLGYSRSYALKIPLENMRPDPERCSGQYCMVELGDDHPRMLAYFNDKQPLTVNLKGMPERMQLEWFDPGSGRYKAGGVIKGNAMARLLSPFAADAVAYIVSVRH